MTELVQGATTGEIVSLEEVLTQLMANDRIDSTYLHVMWERFTLKQPDVTPEESRIAVLLISMCANANSSLIRDNLDILVSNGLGERANMDLVLATNTLSAIKKAINSRGKIDTTQPAYRLPPNHELFTRIYDLLLLHINDEKSVQFLPFANLVIKCFFLLSSLPNQITERLLKECIRLLLAKAKDVTPENTETISNSEPMYDNYPGSEKYKLLNTTLLSRFLFLVGETALNELLFVELDITAEIKVRNALKQQQEEERNKAKKSAKTPNRRKSALPKTPGENLDEEIGLAGSQADDDTDFLLSICNEEIVMSKLEIFSIRF